MTFPGSDAALLESALASIEKVLARIDADMHGLPYGGPTLNAPLEEARHVTGAPADLLHVTPACSAANICLGAAAALVDVSQALMRHGTLRESAELEREWRTLITHTKTASRSAYRAALLMTEQKHLPAAQGRWPLPPAPLPVTDDAAAR